MKVHALRRENLRALIGERGGLTDLSNRLGYKNPSFLSQMAGPNPTREVTEKTARKIEMLLRLPVGALDKPVAYADHQPSDDTMQLVADALRLVGKVCQAEGVNLGPEKFAEIAALALEDGAGVKPDRVRRLVGLLK